MPVDIRGDEMAVSAVLPEGSINTRVNNPPDLFITVTVYPPAAERVPVMPNMLNRFQR